MKIIEHRLCKNDNTPYSFIASPNHGGKLQAEYLVMHYTAGRNAKESISWLTNPLAKASAHLVISREGDITQLVPFNLVAWHAGKSTWRGLVGLNQYALGIEMDNAGRLQRQGGKWQAWFGDKYKDSEVLEALHRDDPPKTPPSGWHIFPPAQIEAALEVASLLVDYYKLEDVIGHDDIAPLRKSDPGPAFPMASFRSRVMGRIADGDQYITKTDLNIRTGPGTEHDKLSASPLPKGTKVEALSESGSWVLVNVIDDTVGSDSDVQGWVHGGYLQRIKKD